MRSCKLLVDFSNFDFCSPKGESESGIEKRGRSGSYYGGYDIGYYACIEFLYRL
jgi:hypothetical protein